MRGEHEFHNNTYNPFEKSLLASLCQREEFPSLPAAFAPSNSSAAENMSTFSD
jgi:hypothetical protein